MLSSRAILPLVVIALSGVSGTSRAGDFSVRAELGGALPLSSPQTQYFGFGFGGTLGAYFGPIEFFDIGAHASYDYFPAVAGSSLGRPGSATLVGVTGRTHFNMSTSTWTPTLELGPSYLITGGESRFGLEIAAGAMVKLGSSGLWLGAAVRFAQLFHLVSLTGVQGFDASLLSFGLALEYSTARPKVAEPQPDASELDADHDGLIGAADKCPTEAEDLDGFEDQDGCPDLDDDADMVPDSKDDCPRVKGVVDLRGCPDRDHDTVADHLDACPDSPGAPPDGCTKFKEIQVTGKKIELRQKIFFAFGRAEILPKSHFLLGEIISALAERPSLCVAIGGHTDSVGSKQQNLALSKDRAAAVRQYVINGGIDAARLTSEGYGPEQPLETNSTPEGRERNRRVEFDIVPCRTPAAQ